MTIIDPTQLVFHDDLPPRQTGGRGGRTVTSPLPDPVIRALRRHPGQWVIVATDQWNSTARAWTKRLHRLGHTDIELANRTSHHDERGTRKVNIWATSNIDVAAPR